MKNNDFVFIDNGALRLFCSNANFRKRLSTKKIISEKSMLIAFPFSFIEFIGLNMNKIKHKTSIELSNYHKKTYSKAFGDIYNEYLDFFQNNTLLSYNELEKAYKKQLNWVDKEVYSIIDDLFKVFLTKGHLQAIYEGLAWDRAISYIPESLSYNERADWLIEVLDQIQFNIRTRNLNIGFYRHFDSLIPYIFRNEETIQNILKKNKTRLKRNTDYLDTDIVNIAVCGYYSNGASLPIRVITCDPKQSVTDRIQMYKGFFKFIEDELKLVNIMKQKNKITIINFNQKKKLTQGIRSYNISTV
jgi:hypothetical protein